MLSKILEPYEYACPGILNKDHNPWCRECHGTGKILTLEGQNLIEFITERIFTSDGNHLQDYQPYED